MTDLTNPYAVRSVAAEAPIAERAAFLQRTYLLVLAGVFGFAFTLWAAGNIAAVNSQVRSLYSNPWIPLIAMFGGGYVVRAIAHRYPLNLVAYFAYVFLMGLLIAPIVLFTAGASPDVLTQASILTALVFTGLTGYTFLTRHDFSFLGGALTIGLFAMLGVGVAGILFGFSMGLWYSLAGVVLFSGYVLYDTSAVLHRYATDRHVSAAIELFTDIVMLFWYLLSLLNRRD
jgi:FtsH-binding integral membrane protein